MKYCQVRNDFVLPPSRSLRNPRELPAPALTASVLPGDSIIATVGEATPFQPAVAVSVLPGASFTGLVAQPTNNQVGTIRVNIAVIFIVCVLNLVVHRTPLTPTPRTISRSDASTPPLRSAAIQRSMLAADNQPLSTNLLHLITRLRCVINSGLLSVCRGDFQNMTSWPLPQEPSPPVEGVTRQVLQNLLPGHRVNGLPDRFDILFRKLAFNSGRFGPLLIRQPEESPRRQTRLLIVYPAFILAPIHVQDLSSDFLISRGEG